MKTYALILALLTVSIPAMAQANEPKLTGTHGDWKTYTRSDGGTRICYVLGEPKSKIPQNVQHGDVYFMVASWQSGEASEQPSLMTGYPLKTNSPPTAKVGSSKFPMYASQNEAFIELSAEERRLVKSMRAGSTMRIEAMSQRGTSVSYNFSLKGVTAALKKAKDNCS